MPTRRRASATTPDVSVGLSAGPAQHPSRHRSRAPPARSSQGSLVQYHRVLLDHLEVYDRKVLEIVRNDAVCRRLMTTPGVSRVVALSYRTAMDTPARFAKVVHRRRLLRLTPRRCARTSVTTTSRTGATIAVRSGWPGPAPRSRQPFARAPRVDGAAVDAAPVNQKRNTTPIRASPRTGWSRARYCMLTKNRDPSR